MSNLWIRRVLSRQAKINRSRVLRRRSNRRLLLQGLETRQLLAGDMMLPAEIAAVNSGTSNATIDSTTVTQSTHSHSQNSSSQLNAVENNTMNQAGHHMANPAAMALIAADQATNTVVSSGNWSDPSVWENGTLPVEGARIIVPQGTTLTVDSVMPTEFKTLGIYGTVQFATDVDTELRVDTIVSAPEGRFEMGTAANPIAANVNARVVFADDGAIDTTWDPEQLSRGAILQGTTEVHGAETTHRVTLGSFPTAGATSVQLSSVPVNWNAGDEIVITGTQGSTSDEVRTIQSIDGKTVNFNEPLQLDHIPPKSDLNVYVANKTRNVQFSSENTDVSRRGHIMLMHTLDANIHNAEFDELGRTDKTRELDDLIFDFPEDAVGNFTSAPTVYTVTEGARTNVRGRYPVHFHRGGVDPSSTPATVSGSVVDGSPGWGMVSHSANVNMINNVSYGVQGAAFYTEVGDEIGSMEGNIAIRTVSPTFQLGDEGAIDPDLRLERMDFGVDGDGYWLSGHMVSMRDNVSAGASGHGIIIWSDGVIEPDLARGRSSVLVSNVENGNLITGRETIPTWWAPMAEMSNNESYGATIGFRSRYVHSQGYLGEIGSDFHTPPDQAYIDTLNPTIDGLTVWGSRDGVLMNYNERMSIKNSRLIGIGAPYVQNGGTADTGVGIDMYNEVTRGPGSIENVSIEGFNMGLLAPRQDDWRLNNLQLNNTTDMLITEMIEGPRTLEMTNVTFGSLDGTAVEDQAANRQNIEMRANFDSNPFQPFNFMMSDRVTLDGQQLYFNQQAADFVPTAGEIAASPGQVPSSMIGLTNQQLVDRFGTSFGGAIIPADATAVDYLTGGVVGSLAAPAATSPPIYHPAGESVGPNGLIIDPGTLTNFDGPVANPDNGEEDDEETDDETVDDEETDDETDDGEETEEDDDEDGGESDEDDDEADDGEETDEGDDETEDGDETDEDGDETDEDGDETDEDEDEVEDGEESDEGDDETGDEEETDEGDDETGDEDSSEGGDVQITTGIQYGQAPLRGTSTPLSLDLYQPNTESETPRPLVVMIHGGGYVAGEPESMGELAQQMASRGYVVASIGYRLNAEDGDVSRSFLEMAQDGLNGTNVTDDQQPPASAIAAGMQDAATALNWLTDNASNYGIDNSRIAVWGESAGAFSALQNAYALDDYGVSVPNISAVVSHMGGLGVDSLMEAGEAPLFIVHGTNDQVVPYVEAEELQAQANSEGIAVQLKTVEGGGHDITFDQEVDGATLFDSAAAFIDTALSHTPEDAGDVGGGEETDEGDDEAEDGEETDEGDDEAEDGEETDEGDDEAEDGEESDEGDDEAEDGEETDEGDDEAEDGEETDEGDDEAEDGEETDEGDDEAEGGEETDEGDDEAEDGEESNGGDDDADLHNDDSPTDVNNDGSTTALDALIVINFLRAQGTDFLQTLSLALQHYVDVNNDQAASAIDALQIINALDGSPQTVAPTQAVDAVFGVSDFVEDDDDELLGLLSEQRMS